MKKLLLMVPFIVVALVQFAPLPAWSHGYGWYARRGMVSQNYGRGYGGYNNYYRGYGGGYGGYGGGYGYGGGGYPNYGYGGYGGGLSRLFRGW